MVFSRGVSLYHAHYIGSGLYLYSLDVATWPGSPWPMFARDATYSGKHGNSSGASLTDQWTSGSACKEVEGLDTM
jgi:hypothetical protein